MILKKVPKIIKKKTAILVGTDKEKIISITKKFLNDDKYYKSYVKKDNPYGDGNASSRIVNEILDKFFTWKH